MTSTRPPRFTRLGVAVLVVVLVIVVGALLTQSGSGSHGTAGLASNPDLDPGTSLSRPAPDFTLSDEFGRPVSLHSYRGQVVILAFNDSECTTVCPLTTTAMLDAKAMLGRAAAHVQLLGVDANPTATSIRDVRAYSETHGMIHSWRFLTGSLAALRQVWKAYDIEVQIQAGQIDHTPALYVIDPSGRLVKVYLTQMSYAAVPQLGRLLAQEASSLLPGHPAVHSSASYAQIPGISPSQRATLPRAGGGTVRLGPSRSGGSGPRLFLFFATWDSEVMNLAGDLESLGRYEQSGLPPVTAVDEASVEPGPGALPRLLSSLPHPLPYPVALDTTGRVADGYEVQDEPWLMLVSGSGQFLWYYDVSVAGWPSRAALAHDIAGALAQVRGGAPSATAAQRELAGSPAPLAGLHAQAGQLLGGSPALMARLHALRGYPVVVNAWASWCTPCRAEFGLFAHASASYGKQVAFLGADTGDSPGDAHAFLAAHSVSYPSYQTTSSALGPLAQVQGLPTTIFINPAGKVVYVHTGQYVAQGTLDQDIQTYALG